MGLFLNTNLMAHNVARNLTCHYARLSSSTKALSSGLRVNSAADDAAGLAIRELMRADIRTLGQGRAMPMMPYPSSRPPTERWPSSMKSSSA